MAMAHSIRQQGREEAAKASFGATLGVWKESSMSELSQGPGSWRLVHGLLRLTLSC